jgi:hypothetical protein
MGTGAIRLSRRERPTRPKAERVRGYGPTGEGVTPHPVRFADSTLGSKPEGRLSPSGRGWELA